MTDVLVVGSGSIGARHARNLTELGAKVTLTDPDGERATAVAADVGGRAVPFTPEVLAEWRAVVIASPTTLHARQASEALAAGAHVMVEKPVATNTDELGTIEMNAGRVMVAYNLRLHEACGRLMSLVEAGDVGDIASARLWFGSWLPDWRPNVDYRTTYSARADLGGGVLLDAIHEIDLLLWLGGDDATFTVDGAIVARVGPLEIDVEDTVRALLRHHDGWVADISLDYLSRAYRRGIEVVGTTATARLDWARGLVELETADGVTTWDATESVDASYEREAERFLSFVERGTPPPVDGMLGAKSLRLAEAIRARSR